MHVPSAPASSLPSAQDMASWARDGVAGLQSVVLYALPELDGAIDAIPLGGLVGDGIFLSLERARKLAARIKRWVALRRTPPQVRPGRSSESSVVVCKIPLFVVMLGVASPSPSSARATLHPGSRAG